jgi:ATP-dependent DNA helicase RecG
MIEAWGRGTLKMSDDCKRHKAIPPSFGYDLSGFVIEFPIPIEEKKGFQKKSPNAKSDTTKEILYNMQQNEKITIVELVKKIGVSRESIKRGIKKLKDTNFIEREGSDKEGRWVILVK